MIYGKPIWEYEQRLSENKNELTIRLELHNFEQEQEIQQLMELFNPKDKLEEKLDHYKPAKRFVKPFAASKGWLYFTLKEVSVQQMDSVTTSFFIKIVKKAVNFATDLQKGIVGVYYERN